MSLRRRIDEARLALMILTVLPAAPLAEPVPPIHAARWALPFVGLPVGLIGWSVLRLGGPIGLPPLVAAMLAIAALAAVTGGLHHDGLSDMADGMGGRDPQRRLEIMRDSRIGSFGALALMIVIPMGAGALADLAHTVSLAAFIMVSVASRLAMVGVMEMLPAARDRGLGRGAAQGLRGAWWPGALLSAILAVLLGFQGFAILGVMAVAASLIAILAWRRLGGQTGDVLGAVQVTAETAGWVALSAAI
ncbi:adenosylcobinamide-GDP ribazoletransferase [Paracoccus angustae]|uniref:Adenosylcobinamide-GDP ribazoletransferase n=1 Tax=Paracoccus angustae TaxID=1671480 RepID=A0ABV7U4Q7_9RHOB